MKKTEIILIIISLIGYILKIFHIPGGSILFVLSLSVLLILYLIFGFALLNNIKLRDINNMNVYKGLTTFKLIGSILVGIVLSSSVLGILFKVQDWRGANTYLKMAIIELIIILVISIFKIYQEKNIFYYKILNRGLIYFFLMVLLVIENKNIPYSNEIWI